MNNQNHIFPKTLVAIARARTWICLELSNWYVYLPCRLRQGDSLSGAGLAVWFLSALMAVRM